MQNSISERSIADEQDYLRLLRGSLSLLAASLATIAICYFWVDRPVAFYVHVVSDVVAGSALGAIVGAYATRLEKLGNCLQIGNESG